MSNKMIQRLHFLLAAFLIPAFSTNVLSALPTSPGQELIACVTEPISSLPIVAGTPLGTLGCQDKLNIAAALGEYEPGSIVIRAAKTLKNLTIRITDVRQANNQLSISANNFSIRYVKVWYQSGESWTGVRQEKRKRALTPELLLNDDSLIQVDQTKKRNLAKINRSGKAQYIDISSDTDADKIVAPAISEFNIADAKTIQPITLNPQQNQQIWLTFRAPENTPPGLYVGQVIFQSGDMEAQLAIPLSFVVRPFHLHEPDMTYSIYYRGLITKDDKGTISSEEKTRTQFAAEMRNLQQHGVSNPTIYQSPEDLTLFNEVLGLRAAAGLKNDVIYSIGINTGGYKNPFDIDRQAKTISTLKSNAKSASAPKILVYGVDEANFQVVSDQAKAWSKIKQAGGDIFAADWKKELEQVYAGKINTLISGIKPDRDSIQYLQARGTSVFLYNQPQVGAENPVPYRLNYGLGAWSYGYDGVMNYAYQGAMGFIWNDFDHPKFRDHVFAYPTSDGVIDTLAWEGFREGVDDVRYITTLAHLAKLHNSQKDLQWIEQIKNQPPRIQDMASYRETVSEKITSLCLREAPATEQLIPCALTPPMQIKDLKLSNAESGSSPAPEKRNINPLPANDL